MTTYDYDLAGHGWMLAQATRTGSYIEALRRVVRPGDTVLDVGTGVGTWALAACRFGARRVYAVDPSDVIHVGRELAAANGCADRIEFIQALSTDITLPEPVDVIVQEIHGVLPMFGPSIAALIDARTRLLKPGGVLVPAQETLRTALVNSPELYAAHDRVWGDEDHGFALDAVRSALVNHWFKRPIRAESLVEAPRTWATLDYRTLDTPDVRGVATWTMTRRSTVHGIAVWFDAVLAEGVELSNAPGVPGLPFGQAFFPVRQPIAVVAGDAVHVELTARLIGRDYVWRWTVEAVSADTTTRVRHDQSDFWRDAISPGVVARVAADYVPQPNPERAIDALILDGFEQRASAGAITVKLASRFPDRFVDALAARERVAALARIYNVVLTGSE